MSLFVDHKLNAFSVLVKDSNDPANEGYRLTNDEWSEIKKLEGDYNAQIALAKQYDAAARARTDADEQASQTARDASTGEAHQDGYR
jgi:hypothetical protein